MSSTYSVLCLSHDPAITAAYDCGSRERAEEAVREGIDGHEHCDLLIGRFSYPLIEAGCPHSKDQPADLRCIHHGTAWADADVLRLLWAAYESEDAAVQKAAKAPEFRCWPPARLRRLRDELGISGTETPAAAAAPPVGPSTCAAYVPPASPDDSGYCARCGMYDWKHAAHAGAPDGPTLIDGAPATDLAVEAVRQLDADPHEGLVVKPYTDHGRKLWVFRCWGTDTCDGWLSLDHHSEGSAISARDRHITDEHPGEFRPVIEGPCSSCHGQWWHDLRCPPCNASKRLDGGPVSCAMEARHFLPGTNASHLGLIPDSDLRYAWRDRADGATPHVDEPKEQ